MAMYTPAVRPTATQATPMASRLRSPQRRGFRGQNPNPMFPMNQPTAMEQPQPIQPQPIQSQVQNQPTAITWKFQPSQMAQPRAMQPQTAQIQRPPGQPQPPQFDQQLQWERDPRMQQMEDKRRWFDQQREMEQPPEPFRSRIRPQPMRIRPRQGLREMNPMRRQRPRRGLRPTRMQPRRRFSPMSEATSTRF